MAGYFIWSGFNYKIELLDKETKENLSITSRINYFNEKEQAKLGVELNACETYYFEDSVFFVDGTFDEIKKNLSIIMRDYIRKMTPKDWREIKNEENNDKKFTSKEEFESYWKRNNIFEDFG